MSPTAIRTETDFPCPCGKPGCFQGVLTSDGGYIKRSWNPFQMLFSTNSSYLMIHAWDAIKTNRQWVELQDKKGQMNYYITVQDAEKHGQWWTPKNWTHHTWGDSHNVYRVPTKYWTVTHG